MNNHINKARAVAAAAAAKASVADEASKAVNFVVTRREQLASSIIFNAVAKNGCPTTEKGINALAQDAVALADATIRELYGKAGRDAAGALAVECFGQKEDDAENPAE